MSRSGYDDDIDDPLVLGRWRAQVRSSIRGKRGQAFLRELAAAMDAMPERVLIADELINQAGDCCAIGVVCKTRGIDVSKIDYDEPIEVADAVGITDQMVREIEYENDEGAWRETDEHRWQRMRRWVASQIVKGVE